MRNQNDNTSTTNSTSNNASNSATFLHSEIFHLKPRKVDKFYDHLVKEYGRSSCPRLQQHNTPMNERSSSTGVEGASNNNSRRSSIIELTRQMNGCLSFDIYHRAENPLVDNKWPFLLHHNHQKRSDVTTTITASVEVLGSEITPDDDSKPLSISESSSGQSDDDQGSSPDIQGVGLNDILVLEDDGTLVLQKSEGLLVSATTTKEEEQETSNSTTKSASEFRLPHQFMVMGHWENREAHEQFYVNRQVQKFFCPLICRKVIESLPILTMWNKQNDLLMPLNRGIHNNFMHSNNNSVAHAVQQPATQESSAMTSSQLTTTTSLQTQNDDASQHFVMTRKRLLKDGSSLEEALTMAKKLAQLSLEEEDGCLNYEICTTGHSDFNEHEILEVGIWKNASLFVHHTNQSYSIECNVSLHPLFDGQSEETSFWERPLQQPVNRRGT